MSPYLDWFIPAAFSAVVAMFAWILRRGVKQGEDLAVIREQITPAGAPSIRARIDDHETRIARIETREGITT